MTNSIQIAHSAGSTLLELVQGDITQQAVDAIVNAANSALLGGGGVDGAIHLAGGPQILEECRAIGGCAIGEAVVTTAGELDAKYVIHAVGPIYSGGSSEEAELLARAYRNSLRRAVEKDASSVAFPSISTGVYSYPLEEASRIALSTVQEFLQTEPHQLATIRFILFDESTFAAYQGALRELAD